MSSQKNNIISKALVSVSFLLMITANALANSIPINGLNTGEVSDSYPNLFAPAGITFAVWGLIYLLLAAYTVFRLIIKADSPEYTLSKSIDRYFVLSSLANTVWIFAWHYRHIGLSLLLMILILTCLAAVSVSLAGKAMDKKHRWIMRLPFSVYFGWITVAAIANFTTWLVNLELGGYGISQPTWTVIIVFVGLIIAMATILKQKDAVFGMVIIWAYLGILIKHTGAAGYNGEYISVIFAVSVSIVLLAASVVWLWKKRFSENKAVKENGA